MDSDFLTSLLPTWHSLIDVHAPELPCPAGAGQSPDCFFTPYWDKSSETGGGLVFDSTLCSLASSPFSLPNASDDGFLIRELIGKMGGSGELSPQNYNPGLLHSENAPKWGHYTSPVNPGFTDLSPAAKFPSLGAPSIRGCTGQFTELAEMGKMMSQVSSSPALRPLGSPVGAPQGSKNQNPASQDRAELSNSREESSVSNPDKNPGLEAGAKPPGEANWRKRKAAPRGKVWLQRKCMILPSFLLCSRLVMEFTFLQEADAEDDSGMKRVKQSDGDNGNEDGSAKTEEEAGGGSDENAGGRDEKLQVKTEAKPPEPPKDYIHVRARRGQATDSHSLAERVRIPAGTKQEQNDTRPDFVEQP